MACSIGTLLDLQDCAGSFKKVVSELNPDDSKRRYQNGW